MAQVLIIGASRGIGLELVRQCRAAGEQVVATARSDAGLAAIEALGAKALRIDVADTASASGLAWQIDGQQFNAVWIVAGAYGPKHLGLQTPSEAEFDQVMHTNVLGPMRVLPQLVDALAPDARLALISSKMGAIGTRSNSYGWLYRASKAAANSVLKDASLQWQGRATCIAFHPGWVPHRTWAARTPTSTCRPAWPACATCWPKPLPPTTALFSTIRARPWPGENTMLLSEDHIAVQDAVRAFVQEQIAPKAAEWDKSHHFPAAELKGLAALGCYGVAVPAEYDGAGLDYLALSIILEEIGAGDGATSTVVSVNNCPVCSILMAFRQRGSKAALPQAPGARRHAGRLLPDGAACRFRSRRPEDDCGSGWRKRLRAQRRQAVHHQRQERRRRHRHGGDRTKRPARRAFSAFLVPTSTPGYTVARIEDKMGQHASDTAQILFENCRIPAANRLGDEGQGLKIALSGLEGGRIGIASQAVGMARAAFEAALKYSKERIAFGVPIFEHQVIQHKLAEMAMQIEAARQLIWHAASLKDAGKPCLKEAAMAKLFATEMAEKVCSAAIQVHGGYGYVSDFPVERIYRDVRVCQIYEGTSEVQKILIGRALI